MLIPLKKISFYFSVVCGLVDITKILLLCLNIRDLPICLFCSFPPDDFILG